MITNGGPGAKSGKAASMADTANADFALLEAAVRDAGALALAFFRNGVRAQRKDDGSDVTEADFAVDKLLRERLVGARPDYGWLSEETADDPSRLLARRVWIVDPIDGTRAFVLNKPEWVISAALVEAGQPVMGIVYNPCREEFFDARRGQGSHLNGEPMHVSQRRELEDARILGSKGLAHQPIWDGRPWPRIDLTWVFSIAYRLALVACGRADAVVALTPKHEWDLAAGALLIHEAGGVVTAPHGALLSYNNANSRCDGILAAGPALHGAIISRVRAPGDEAGR
jgi:myo-inositol-1(or 4)-monophosphatase